MFLQRDEVFLITVLRYLDKSPSSMRRFFFLLLVVNIFYRFLLTEYGKAVAEKHGFSEEIDENGCVVAKVYYQLVRKTSRRKR